MSASIATKSFIIALIAYIGDLCDDFARSVVVFVMIINMSSSRSIIFVIVARILSRRADCIFQISAFIFEK